MESIPRTSGVYQIVCSASKKTYIGSTANLMRRKQAHWADLATGKHDNIHLQRAWDKYGIDAFSFEVIELVLAPFLREREQYWIDKKQAANFKRGYNIAPSALIPNGRPVSEEARKKISAALKGHPGFAKTRETRIATLKARAFKCFGPQSPETCAKKSARLKGRAPSAATMAASIARAAKVYVVTFPDGHEELIKNLNAFCREHGLTEPCMRDVVAGRSQQHRGYKARWSEAS